MLYGPSRLTARVSSQSRRVLGSVTWPRRMIPALLTRIEIRPVSRPTVVASASQDGRSVTSQARPTASPPTALATRTAAPTLISTETIRAPAPAIACAMASPIPDPAPVTSAIRPSSKPGMAFAPTYNPSPAPREREGPSAERREGEGCVAAAPSPGSLRSPPSPAPRRARGLAALHRLLLHSPGADLGERRRLGCLERIGRCPARTHRVRQGRDPGIPAHDIVAVGLRR